MITFKESSPIVDVTFLKTNQDPEIASQKTSIVDILCKDTKGNQYIVEMQVAKEKGFALPAVNVTGSSTINGVLEIPIESLDDEIKILTTTLLSLKENNTISLFEKKRIIFYDFINIFVIIMIIKIIRSKDI